jgi:NAD(P)-dependent dehydrogenase (short-subunit alcohol dehydrogenase family)
LLRIHAGRGRHPHELAAPVLFLVSDAAPSTTGQTLIIDRGRTIF